ncbi:MAG TPA: hypothetical protein P5250_06725, partial [Bacteroidales bacterium]|nr:hypothetical protein [Bacteroidales bacterium]
MKIIKKKHIHRLILLLSIFFIASCELINPPEKTPSFVHIQAINLSTNVIEQGTNSSKITDAWVYVDEDIIGAFELPATIPILKTGYHKITIKPGIQLNGTAATRSIYPFYNPIELNIQLVEDQILDLGTLTTTYNNNTKFAWKEDFEQAGITIDPSSKSDTNIKKITDPNKVFEGNGSGIINLDNIKSIFEGISNVAYTLPNDGKSVFL